MIVYVIVNECERTHFEKTFQIPFGYGNEEYVKIFIDELSARRYFDILPSKDEWVIEKISSGVKEIIS